MLSITLVVFSKPIEITINTNSIGSRRLRTLETKRETRLFNKKILKELRKLDEIEKLNPQDNADSRQKFLSNFDWKDSMLQQHEIKQIESLLVEFHDIFARHRFDIGVNEEFTVKLTPKDESPAYSQSLPTPVNLKGIYWSNWPYFINMVL